MCDYLWAGAYGHESTQLKRAQTGRRYVVLCRRVNSLTQQTNHRFAVPNTEQESDGKGDSIDSQCDHLKLRSNVLKNRVCVDFDIVVDEVKSCSE
jgi:hypothetical protein